MSSRDIQIAKKILLASPEGILSVTYCRLLEGRWYARARGIAQLQNCKKQIRNLALRGEGIGIDLRASYPSILAGLISENVRERGTTFEIKETHRMLRDLKSWRADVARELSVNSARVKKGVNTIIFGMKSTKWRRIEHISDDLRSPTLDRFEKMCKRLGI